MKSIYIGILGLLFICPLSYAMKRTHEEIEEVKEKTPKTEHIESKQADQPTSFLQLLPPELGDEVAKFQSNNFNHPALVFWTYAVYKPRRQDLDIRAEATFSPRGSKIIVHTSGTRYTEILDTFSTERLEYIPQDIIDAIISPSDLKALLAFENKPAHIIDLATGNLELEIPDIFVEDGIDSFGQETFRVYALFSNSEKYIAYVTKDNTLLVVDIKTGKKILDIKGITVEKFDEIRFNQNDSCIFIAYHDQTAQLIDINTRKPLFTIPSAHRFYEFNPESNSIAGITNENKLELWNILTKTKIAEFNNVKKMYFTRVPSLIEVHNIDESAYLYDMHNNRIITLEPRTQPTFINPINRYLYCIDGNDVFHVFDIQKDPKESITSIPDINGIYMAHTHEFAILTQTDENLILLPNSEEIYVPLQISLMHILEQSTYTATLSPRDDALLIESPATGLHIIHLPNLENIKTMFTSLSKEALQFIIDAYEKLKKGELINFDDPIIANTMQKLPDYLSRTIRKIYDIQAK